ncbi:hypothetical protein E4656_08485 [Natronospirillum operosum]|uniref:Uncharacterized protein n=1 Tax=Natronospirillum operosum TaxID=2759953 RepID=A0A4Z0WCI3_9GAMM|nr:hypothetical protein [Natronospirillum operosum]TGG94195.1 hypothetical protein E4656_08485 [Natronospirillum operosum]
MIKDCSLLGMRVVLVAAFLLLLTACDTSGGGSDVTRPGGAFGVTDAVGYFKAHHPRENASFGSAVALSADGDTLAVGDPWEFGTAAGVGGNAALPSPELTRSGAVFLY